MALRLSRKCLIVPVIYRLDHVIDLLTYVYVLLFVSFSGAGDETLRFWQVFPGPRSNDKNRANGLLFPFSPGSVIR